MNFEQRVSMQGKYRITSRDRETQEVLDRSGWSDNQIIRSSVNAVTIYETGLPDNIPFQVGYTENGNFDTFENVIALTPTTKEVLPVVQGFVDANDVYKGYRIVGGGNYKFLPDTTVKGLKVNQVGIAGFSIAQVKNDEGMGFIYPITPNVELEIEFVLTIILRPANPGNIATVRPNTTAVKQSPCKINIGINAAQVAAGNYQWQHLLSRNEAGMMAFTTVNGVINDQNVLKNFPTTTPSRWQDPKTSTENLVAGEHLRRGYVYDAYGDVQYIRLGISAGVPGVYISVMFLQNYVFKHRTLTDINIINTFTPIGE